VSETQSVLNKKSQGDAYCPERTNCIDKPLSKFLKIISHSTNLGSWVPSPPVIFLNRPWWPAVANAYKKGLSQAGENIAMKFCNWNFRFLLSGRIIKSIYYELRTLTVGMKRIVFWDVTPRSLVEFQCHSRVQSASFFRLGEYINQDSRKKGGITAETKLHTSGVNNSVPTSQKTPCISMTKDQLLNTVYRNKHCLFWESYETGGGTLKLVVKALCYIPEGRGLRPDEVNECFKFTWSFRPQ
jgi:hypothetical protein